MKPERNLSLRALIFLLVMTALTACSPDPATCDVDGRTIEQGESVTLSSGRVCSCTSTGITCGEGQATDGALDAAVSSDGSMASDAAMADGALNDDDGGPDASAAEDMALSVDMGTIVEPETCPDAPPSGPCTTPNLSCGYGQPFTCCGAEFPGRKKCTCSDGLWSCTDHVQACEAMEDDSGCARRALVCARWSEMQAQDQEGEWEGDVNACVPGDMSADWRDRVRLHLNGYRFMAGLNSVQFDERKNRQAQDCALAIHAGGRLIHNLTDDMSCYTDDAALAARKSNLDSRPAIAALSRYMIDPGANNFGAMRHRLWMLAPELGPVGVGSTDRASCLHVIGGNGNIRDPQFVAWPPAGPVPFEATRADQTGWTIHSNAINLSRANISLTVDGEARPIDVRTLDASGTAAWAMAFRPMGWSAEPGVAYTVRVDDVYGNNWEGPIEYTVEMVDCP